MQYAHAIACYEISRIATLCRTSLASRGGEAQGDTLARGPYYAPRE